MTDGIIEYGWRRFNTQILTGTVNNYSSVGYRGGTGWWLGEIADQIGYPKTSGGGPAFYGGYGINLNVYPQDSKDDLIIVGAMLEGSAVASDTNTWELEGCTWAGNTGILGGNYKFGVWTSSTQENYMLSPYNGKVQQYSYVFLNGYIRQSMYGNAEFPTSGMGSPTPLSFPKAPLQGSMILAFNLPGVYGFYGSGYQTDPNPSPNSFYWVLLTDDIAFDASYSGFGGLISTKWFASFNGDGDETIGEGWVTEQLRWKNRIVTLSGNAAKGSLNVYNADGQRLLKGTDWEIYSEDNSKIKISKSIRTSYLTVTYLNIQHRLRYGFRSRVITDNSTTHDRIRFNDVRGL